MYRYILHFPIEYNLGRHVNDYEACAVVRLKKDPTRTM